MVEEQTASGQGWINPPPFLVGHLWSVVARSRVGSPSFSVLSFFLTCLLSSYLSVGVGCFSHTLFPCPPSPRLVTITQTTPVIQFPTYPSLVFRQFAQQEEAVCCSLFRPSRLPPLFFLVTPPFCFSTPMWVSLFTPPYAFGLPTLSLDTLHQEAPPP